MLLCPTALQQQTKMAAFDKIPFAASVCSDGIGYQHNKIGHMLLYINSKPSKTGEIFLQREHQNIFEVTYLKSQQSM